MTEMLKIADKIDTEKMNLTQFSVDLNKVY